MENNKSIPRGTTIKSVMDYFFDLHDNKVNQKYGEGEGLPYSYHLNSVKSLAVKYSHLLPSENLSKLVYSALAHDSIEDARKTYNDITKLLGKDIAEIVFLCTDYSGRNREERKPFEYYKSLSQNNVAVYIKLCDIMANTLYGIAHNSKMVKTYAQEYELKTKKYLYKEEFKELFDDLELLFKLGVKN